MRNLPAVNVERLKDKASLCNTEIACLLLGWQGGTIHQVAEETGLSIAQILGAKDIQALIESLPKYRRLFIGFYPEGIVYADRHVEEHGDYKKVAFLSYRTLELTLYDCPSELKDDVISDANSYMNRAGEQINISTSGQKMTLGWGLKEAK